MNATSFHASRRWIEVDGVRLAASECGVGPPVVLIHGTAPPMWFELPERLAQDHRVVTYDRRSYGESIHGPIADTRRHVLDAVAVLEAITGPAILVGWSIGGVIALHVAGTRPSLVQGLVLIEPPLWAARHITLPMAKGVLGARGLGALGFAPRGAEWFLHWALHNTRRDGNVVAELPDETRAAIVRDGRAIVRELAAGTGEELKPEDLLRVRAPGVWLVGADSHSAFHAAANRALVYLTRIDLELVKGSAHAMQRDRPDAICRAVESIPSQ